MIIQTHREILPSFGIKHDQAPLHIWSLLCKGMSGRDCAAYQGIAPDLSMCTEDDVADMHDRIREGGRKMSEHEARRMFGDFTHEGVDLAYRR